METEETKGLAVPHVTSPTIEATPTSPEKIEALSVPLSISPVSEPMQASHDETKQLPVSLPVSPVIEPISLSQLNPGPLEEPSQQTETSDAQVGNVALHQQFPDTVIKEALKALIDNSISVVEYGNQVLYRCGYAEVLIAVEWIVPDKQLLLASQVLLEHNWPRLLYHERDWTGYPKVDEYWESRYLMHDLDGQGWMRVHLMPMSLVGFTLEETVEVPSTFAHELHLRTPKPPHYMSSLIRHLLQLPIEHDSRLRVEKDLMAFISAYILKDGPANTTMWTHLDDQESDEDYQKRVEEGVRFMKTWDWSKIEERYLAIAECAVRDCRYIHTLTDVQEEQQIP
ncbi:hypothetical protein N7519_002126 [Penicillium mononematosum]|uniref:uncharacterized protein n=1 Tax=Penicillium mononematosum TaxID=268346 RepID=UPI002546AFCD|nr:uncharacterized protein N7519_002126 [Penicillium mononematosum]KAJ6187218.1 hypothetical protein N7519_002126 [Penicillium mononematosum]